EIANHQPNSQHRKGNVGSKNEDGAIFHETLPPPWGCLRVLPHWLSPHELVEALIPFLEGMKMVMVSGRYRSGSWSGAWPWRARRPSARTILSPPGSAPKEQWSPMQSTDASGTESAPGPGI